jgi:DNA helicase-2/ATP-dependent DNA helicase PcrA
MNQNDKLHFSEMLSILNSNDNDIPNFMSLLELRNSSFLENQIGKPASDLLNCTWDLLSQDKTFRFERVLENFRKYCEKTSNFNNDEERFLVFNDYQAWIERWGTYCRKTSVEDRSISDLMRSIALGITNISSDKGLILSTVHMAKGLEFDVVFIMGLNEGTFPDYRTLNNPEQLTEEKHNMFVSITRAKRLCYLSYPLEKVMPWGGIKSQLPSRFIDKSWIAMTE